MLNNVKRFFLRKTVTSILRQHSEA